MSQAAAKPMSMDAAVVAALSDLEGILFTLKLEQKAIKACKQRVRLTTDWL